MPNPLINIGSAANDGTGELGPRGWLQKVNRLPVPDSTINAGSGDYTGTTEQKITAAIAAAVAAGAKYVWVPQSMLPYNAGLVTFSTSVRMICEGANPDWFVVRAYGAFGDGATDDTAAIQAAINGAAVGLGTVCFEQLANAATYYIVLGTLSLKVGIRLMGLGGISPTIKSTGSGVSLLNWTGTTEAQLVQIEIRNLTFLAATVGTNIGICLRNFQACVLEYVSLVGFRVGIWAEWGLGVIVNHSTISLCTRGVQLGGNLAQTETPVPGAGVRAAPGTAYMDSVNIWDTGFSNNQVDINDMGSQQALGGLVVWGSNFFESGSVAGKTQYVHVTRRKAFVFRGNWIESPNANRDGLNCQAFDYDANAAAPVYGADIQGNHFLFTSNTGCNPINVVRGQATIKNNILEIATGGTTVHVRLGDSGNSSFVESNTYLAYPDSETIGLFALTGSHTIWSGTNFAGQQAILQLPGIIRDTPVALTSGATPAIDASTGTYFTLAILTNIAVTIGVPTNPPTAGQSQDIVIAIRNSSGGALGTAPTFNTGANGFKFAAVTNPANGTQVEYRFRWDPVQSFWLEVGTHLAAGI